MKIGPTIREKVFVKYQGHCAYCGRELDLNTFTVDHIIPQAKGGKNQLDNYNPCCKRCNTLKADHSLVAFRNIIKWKINEEQHTLNHYKKFCNIRCRIPEKIEVKFYYERFNFKNFLKKLFKFMYIHIGSIQITNIIQAEPVQTTPGPASIYIDPCLHDNYKNEFYE